MTVSSFGAAYLSRDGLDLAAYRKSISEMFGTLPPEQQRSLAEQLAVLPRYIHALAASGRILDHLPAPGSLRRN